MPIIPYNPFRMMRHDDEIFPSFPRLFGDDWFDGHFRDTPYVRVDVRENQNEIIVAAEIPGLEKKEDVSITVHDNHLYLSGKIQRINEEQGENVHRTERYYGQFSRTVPLPVSVSETEAKASYKNGILEVRIPKTSKQTGHQIDVDFQ